MQCVEMEDDINNACRVLMEGGVILYPTDTIWGIGCDATNAEAVKKVYALKRRIETKAMLVLVDNLDRLKEYVLELPQQAVLLMEQSAKPLTIIYPVAKKLAGNLISQDGSVGIRITKESFSRKLCATFGKPIVSTSANVSGVFAPACFEDIDDEIKIEVDYVVNYRQDDTKPSIASKIVKLNLDGTIHTIRE